MTANLTAIIGTKGGIAKSTNCHLLCLGSTLAGIPSVYVLTDPNRQIRDAGRPYAVLDGRTPDQLALLIEASKNYENCNFFIDGGGNRPDFDDQLAELVHFSIIPFKNSDEDVDVGIADMKRISQAFAWPSAWPTNAFAEQAAQRYIDRFSEACPLRVMSPSVPAVNSVTDLLSTDLGNPSSSTRLVAKKAFSTYQEFFATHSSRSHSVGEAHGLSAAR